MKEKESRQQRRDRQHRELEENQQGLRESIASTQRFLHQSDEIIKRHRQEWDENDD